MTPDTVTVAEGDLVRLRISSAEPTRVHLHGYDLDGFISRREPATFSFEATVTGRFEIEDHGSERVLGSLVVRPR